MYKIIRFFLFLIDPEKAHSITGFIIKSVYTIPLFRPLFRRAFVVKNPALEKTVFGIKFPNPIGLAAGFDKNATLYTSFSSLGFGFIEIGTVTPKGQSGNPKKRLFRLQKNKGLINRMGFNNDGVEKVVKRLKTNKNIIVGGNIGKNAITPNEKAIDDYLFCFKKLFNHVQYFAINVSSPNTKNLRKLQEKEALLNLLNTLQGWNHKQKSPKPILLKIAPDLDNRELDDIVQIVLKTKIAGIIATNTSINKECLSIKEKNSHEQGGISGVPVAKRSTEVIRYLKKQSKDAFAIIGVGGISTEKDAIEKLNAGADLIQLYTGFVYKGPSLIKRINNLLIQNN